MFINCQNEYLSNQSVVFNNLKNNNTESVGKDHPIMLPFITIDKIQHIFGKKIANGDVGTIYEVKNCIPSRVFKVIPQNVFKDGNEIKISKIAGDLGVAPKFYSAFLVEQNSKKFVFIEMDNAGKSLGKWMEELAEKGVDENKEAIEEKKTN